MIQDLFERSKYLFVVFSPGHGGNHLSNLLSLSDAFDNRFDSIDYETEMISKYKKRFVIDSKNDYPIAHFGDIENIRTEYVMKYYDKITNPINKLILCGHYYEYAGNYDELQTIKNKDHVIILLSMVTEKNKEFYDRVFNGPWLPGNSIQHIQYYNLNSFTELTGKKDNVVLLNTDKFLTFDGFDYLQSVLKENLNITLPDTAKIIHNQYISHWHFIYKILVRQRLTINGV